MNFTNAQNVLGFPSAVIINEVIRSWEPDASTFIGSSLLPMKEHPIPQLRWDVLGASSGLTSAHNLDAEPKMAAFKKLETKLEETAYWKETARINESELLNTRMAGTLDKPAGESLVMSKLQHLSVRLDSRIEQLIWSALQGTVTIDENNVKRTVSYGIPGGNVVTAGTPWSTTASADPISNLQAWSLLLRGKAGMPVTCYVNRKVANYLAQNAKVRDLVKQSSTVLQMGTDNVGEVLSQLTGGISSIRVYDEGYFNSAGTWTPFIPDTLAILVGKVPYGQPLGHFMTTPSLHNGGIRNPRPGKFSLMEDHSNEGNPYVDLTAGIYGLPVLQFPEAVIVATVA